MVWNIPDFHNMIRVIDGVTHLLDAPHHIVGNFKMNSGMCIWTMWNLGKEVLILYYGFQTSFLFVEGSFNSPGLRRQKLLPYFLSLRRGSKIDTQNVERWRRNVEWRNRTIRRSWRSLIPECSPQCGHCSRSYKLI